MAEYTITLRRMMETEEGKELLNLALSTYPLYAPKKLYDMIPTREELNQKLLNRYKYREIGFDTTGRFLDELEISMCEIMPRYNELFKTVEIMADLPNPFDNVDVTETFEQTSSNTATSEGSTNTTDTTTGTQNGTNTSERTGTDEDSTSGTGSQTSNGKRLDSDTPQDSLSIGTKNIDSVNYASSANWNEDIVENETSSESSRTSSENITGTTENETSSTSTGTGSSNTLSESSGTLSHTFTKKGNQGVNTYAHDMNEFRTSIIDIIGQILEDPRITELFMLVY